MSDYKRDAYNLLIAYGGVVNPVEEYGQKKFSNYYGTTISVDYKLTLAAYQEILKYGFIADKCSEVQTGMSEQFADTFATENDKLYFLYGEMYLGSGNRRTWAVEIDEEVGFGGTMRLLAKAPNEKQALEMLAKRLEMNWVSSPEQRKDLSKYYKSDKEIDTAIERNKCLYFKYRCKLP